MAKDKKSTKSTEELLLELTSNNKDSQNEIPKPKEVVLTKPKSSQEELQDLTSTVAQASKSLTETDYFVLEQHCLGTSEEVICEQFNISKGYFNSLLRNSNASIFLDKYSKSIQQKVLARGMGAIANAWDKKVKKLDKLFAEGKDDMAFAEMFGKLSFIEAQEKLAKMNTDEEEDTSAPIQNLFINLQQRE